MFRGTKAFSSFSVSDIPKAKTFYEAVLGLEVSVEDDLLNLHIAGGIPILVYPKPNHTPATYTILNLPVPDIQQAISELRKSGVQFEHYDEPVKTDENDVFTAAGVKQAWFKDPAGNIISVIETT